MHQKHAIMKLLFVKKTEQLTDQNVNVQNGCSFLKNCSSNQRVSD